MKTLHVAAMDARQLGQELMSVLEGDTLLEFKDAFDRMYASMRERHTLHGSEETLRLTAYDVLQRLVSCGCVEKVEKKYRAKPDAKDLFREHEAAEHCRELLQAVQQTE
jgi:hypothetical protein